MVSKRDLRSDRYLRSNSLRSEAGKLRNRLEESGQPITDAYFRQELSFVQHELTTDYSGAAAEQASDVITAQYQIPADIPREEVTRDGDAQQIYDA